MKASSYTLTILSAVFILAGAAIYVCPTVASLLSRQHTEQEEKTFQEKIQSLQAKTSECSLKNSTLEKLLQRAESYNKQLYLDGQKDLKDPFSYEVSSIDLSEYGIADNLFGFLEIPKINVKLGIYLGATSANMAKGAAHLTQTSLPIGGINTNSVIAAHRGTRHQDMFLHIDQLKPGDKVIITNPWKTLIYRVTTTEIIAPNAIEKVLIQPGRDMVTLISCNPYGKSTQRYVVYCDRVQSG
ncbi:MAG: class C sortase [Thermocaproicibacter melissae]|uniref:class C sortase n=1 Tax=Thermocaproicibacter melissae TaxID=2966552 RepID=UPI0024B25815|nr:class C sortase [Thermocaproicibacter melissae]WBY65004.1 class C sortase [Thermocaproicibacter melissae]